MPRPGPRRPYLGIKADPHQLPAIDKRVEAERATGDKEANRSELARRLLEYGLRHMPQGWKP